MNIKQLFIHCRAREYEQIIYLLSKKKDGRYNNPKIIAALAKHPVLDVLCEIGDIKILQLFLVKKTDGSYEFPIFLKTKRAIEIAALHGNIDILEYLVSGLFPEVVNISHLKKALEIACIKNNIVIVKFILQKFPETQDISFDVLVTIFNKGNVELLKYFLSTDDDGCYNFPKIVKLIQSDSRMLLKACVSGNFAIVEILMAKLPDGSYEFQEIIKKISSHDHLIFKTVFHGSKNIQNEKILELLLKVPEVFSYIESQGGVYTKILSLFTQKYLEDLQQEIAKYYEYNPAGVFVLSVEDAKLCYFFIRNAIRNNELARVNLLLSIDVADPAEKILAHDAELLKTALSYGRSSIIHRLVEYPEIRIYIENNVAFKDILDESESELLETVLDRESSVIALAPHEQAIWDSIRQHYHDKLIDLGGVKSVFELFKTYLKQCYIEDPIFVDEIQLPFEISELEKLRKEHDESFYVKALQGYYTNIYHTAYRYLSKPNPLLSPDALFVEAEGELRYSLVEPYAETIAYFYLAASDESFACTYGGTVRERINLFIKNISLIARSHNWDPPESGSEVALEEKDDLQGDKPSCFSGVKKRLFSLPGHSMFDVLSKEKVQEELRYFIRTYYEITFAKLTKEQLTSISSAVNLLFYETKEIEPALLKLLSISGDDVSQFIVNLRVKYGHQFNSFELFARRSLVSSSGGCVFVNFYLPMGLGEILDAALRSKGSLSFSSGCRYVM